MDKSYVPCLPGFPHILNMSYKINTFESNCRTEVLCNNHELHNDIYRSVKI